ncbi:chitin synthase activator [Seiridium cupressi]
MAYNGGFQEQRPYAGPAGRRPAPGGNMPPPPQQYDQYQDDYGYDYNGYDDGYDQGYGAPQQDMNYGRGRPPPNGNFPPQDGYGGGPGRGGRPPPQNTRGPMPRGRGGPAPGPGRGGFGPGPGGRPGPLERSASSDPLANRRGAPNVISPQEQSFGSPFPNMPGKSRRSDLDEENRILAGMENMSMSGGGGGGRAPPRRQNMPPPGNRGPGQRRPTMDDGYGGRPSMDSQRGGPRGPPQGFPDRRGPPPGPGYGGFHDDGYGGGMPPDRDGYGPPGRSMTLPSNPEPPMGMGMRSPPRGDSIPHGPPVRGLPARPSTAQGNRPPPQRMYPPQGPPGPPGPPGPQEWDNYEPPGQAPWAQPPVRASFGDFYDAYYHPRNSDNQYPPGRPNDIPDFDEAPSQGPRGSFDQHMRPGPGMPQQGPARVAELSRTKSQPNLREPQAAVFEMAGDLPPVPTGGFQAYNPQQPGPPAGSLPNVPPAKAPQSGPGSGHPAPIRPGLMPNSMVNMQDRPAPQRQYTGPPPAAMLAQGRPQPSPQQHGRPGSIEHVPVTVEELERLRAVIKNEPNDQQSALTLAKKLVEAADVLVPKLPDPKARARSRERYVMDAHKILKKLVSAQNSDAMFFLADCMGRGILGFEPDNKEAFTLYQSAAKLGHAAAAYRTAVCCELGNDDGGGTRKDPLKAIQWYKRAATLGDTPAMYKVGMIMLKGLLGQAKNPREAVGWLKRAAERADVENPHALHELGLLYESAQPNDVILRDEPYALQLFEQAANLGYKFSQFRMGCAYEYGLMGCPIDPRSSIMWYSRAATQEEHQSELALSGWYLTGTEGVLQQSDTEAYLWARKAAQAGLAKAEYAMGYFTEVGIGIPANLEDAKRWYWRAAAQNFPKARERLEDLKRSGKNGGPRQRERISRSKIGKQQEGECSVM